VQVRDISVGGNAAETFLTGEADAAAVPLFTYRSPARRWGLIFVGGGAALLVGAMWLFIKGIVEATTTGGSIFGAFLTPFVLAVIAVALIVGGGTGLFVSWFGPTSLDDYEGPGDAPIWGRCPRCGSKNARGAVECAKCGRPLYPSQHRRVWP